MRALLLTTETKVILTRIRTYGWTLFVFGMSPGEAWRLVKARVERRIQRAGVALQVAKPRGGLSPAPVFRMPYAVCRLPPARYLATTAFFTSRKPGVSRR